MSKPVKKADVLLKNGVVYTVDAAGTVAEAIGWRSDEIVFVGSNREAEAYTDADTKIIDLDGKMVLPGFIDCHTHPSCAVDIVYALDLNGLGSADRYLEKIREAAQNPNAQFVYGFGWDEAVFENRKPTKEMLDAISTGLPIVMWDEPYHSLWVNSAALQNAGISAETFLDNRDIERDENGEPTGLIHELGTELITETIPPYSPKQCLEGLRFYQKLALRCGYTSLSECCVYSREDKMGYPGLRALHAFTELHDKGELKCRIFGSLVVEQEEGTDAAQHIARMKKYKEETENDRFSMNIVKIYLDYWEEEALKALAAEADRAGFQLFMHALQEYETTRGLNICEAVQKDRDSRKGANETAKRHAIAHVGVVSGEQIARFAEYETVSVILPQWFGFVEEYYGRTKERYDVGKLDPTESFFENGVVVASGTAYPAITTNPRPLEAIQMGMTRRPVGAGGEKQPQPPAGEQATLDQMIRSFTINAAYLYHEEDRIGSLEVGKCADLVILDRDIRTVDCEEIYLAQEECTIIGGEMVYRRGECTC